MMTPEIVRRLHAIREGAIAPDSAKAQQIMTLAFQQDPLLSVKILDAVGEAHLRKSMAAAGMDKASMELALRQEAQDDPTLIEDPFLAPQPPKNGQQVDAERKKRAAADPKDDIRAPIADRALDYMDDMLQGPKPFGIL